MPTDTKRQAVTELAELLRNSSAMAVADYRGLKVSDMQAVRRTLRESGVELHIAKNRLLKIAADEADRTDLKPMLSGPTALATIAGDEAAMAKALADAFRPYSRIGITLRGGMLGDRASMRRSWRAWPRCRHARSCSARSPAGWPHRSPAWPACSPRTSATWWAC